MVRWRCLQESGRRVKTKLFLLLTFFTVSCRPPNPFIGRWVEQKYGEEWMEFYEDTYFAHSYDGNEFTIPYSYDNDTLFVGAKDEPLREATFNYRFTNGDLVLSASGSKYTYEKVEGE
jgi:hypothetical protein